MKVVSIISLFIIFISVFGITITYIGFQTISPTIGDFENSINTVRLELEEYISSTIDNTSQSLDSASKSLEFALASTYLTGKTAYQASKDFGKISKILSITFGLFDQQKI